MCHRAFEKDDKDLAEHVRQHGDKFFERNGDYQCNVCEVTFTPKADFQFHHRSVSKGLCGFRFKFAEVQSCSDRHPPADGYPGQLHVDAIKAFTVLRHWEHAQLQTFRSALEEIGAVRQGPDTGVYSIEVAARLSPDTLASLPVSVKTFASAPCDRDKSGKYNVLGLQQRLRTLTLRNRPT